MNDQESNNLDESRNSFTQLEPVRSNELRVNSNDRLTDKSFKNIDMSLLGFQEDGIIENKNMVAKTIIQQAKGPRRGTILLTKSPLLDTIQSTFNKMIDLNNISVFGNNRGINAQASQNLFKSKTTVEHNGLSPIMKSKPPMVPKGKLSNSALSPVELNSGSFSNKHSNNSA